MLDLCFKDLIKHLLDAEFTPLGETDCLSDKCRAWLFMKKIKPSARWTPVDITLSIHTIYWVSTTTPPAFPTSIPRSNILFPNGSNRPCVFRLAPYLVIPNSPEHNHKEDQDGPIEVLGIGVWRNGEEHEDEQRGLEGEGSELGKAEVSKRVGGWVNQCWTGKGESATHAKLQKRPKWLPRLKREGGIGSLEKRRDTMQPMHSM
jgi:hypothetical protein